MAKLLVLDEGHGDAVPFLRGILTRSLQEAGLEFEQAYDVASTIREELAAESRVSTRRLRARVLKHLRRLDDRDLSRRYQQLGKAPGAITVLDHNGQTSPFSRDRHQRSLETAGAPSVEAATITEAIHRHLLDKGLNSITSRHLDRLTYSSLEHELGEASAHRYLVWRDFQRSGRPLILLIGGTTGCGKSTIATHVAGRLDIVRTQSTDMLREVMRTMVSERLLPVLHKSSFEAWKALPESAHPTLEDGYYAQAELLSLACEAVVERALRERVSLILEGVHIQPTLIERIGEPADALFIPVMLAVLKPKRLKLQIRGRASEVPQRRSQRYLKNFDAIWQLQSMLLSEADRTHIPIIENTDKDKVFQELMRLVISRLSQGFDRTADDVFGRYPGQAEVSLRSASRA